jgi:uncharacterized membrane protein
MKENLHRFVHEYESFVKEYESSSLVNENAALKQELEMSKKTIAELEKKYEAASRENTHLKLTLREQILDEKLAIIKLSQKKLETYFKSQARQQEDSLSAIAGKARQRVEQLRKLAAQDLEREKSEFSARLNELSEELQGKIADQRKRMYREDKEVLSEARAKFDVLAAEELSEEVVKERVRQNQLEMKIGLNIANKIGILLILFGVAAAFRYTYGWFSDYMKGIVFFILGVLMLAGGELFYRKEKDVFSTGLIGGGIAVLYSSIFYSHFLLNIMNMSTAFGLVVMVTATAVVLSLRYNSKTICSLGLAGGYLPLLLYVFSYGLPALDFNSAMGYLFVLNLSILLISFYKRWSIVNYISFILNIPTQAYLIMNLQGEIIGILFSILTFFMYLGITLGYPLRYRRKLNAADIVLLGLNTSFNSVLIYGLLGDAGLGYLRGLMALVFCLSYAFLARFTLQRIKGEVAATTLFYSTALTFAVLMIPLQFGIRWLSLGWLVEGAVLVIYGFKNRIKRMEQAGWAIFLLCLAAFYLYDFQALSGFHVPYFNFKYFSVTAGMLLITFNYLKGQKYPGDGAIGRNIAYFKYLSLFNLWVYLLYSGTWFFNYATPVNSHRDLYRWLIVALLTFGTGYAVSSVPLFYDRVVRYFSMFLYLAGCLFTLHININIPVLRPLHWLYGTNGKAEYLAMGVLVAYNIFVLLCARRLILAVIRDRNLSLEIYPLFMGVYLLVTASVFLLFQFRLSLSNLAFSLSYLLLAVSFILFGFKQKYVSIRRLGLGLSLFSTAKLFLFDLSYLTSVRRIIAYFCFGLMLVGISYIYQRLEKSVEGFKHAEKM